MSSETEGGLSAGGGSDPESELICKAELARRLMKAPRTIEHWQREGIIPVIKLGRSVLYDWPVVLEHLKRHFLVCGEVGIVSGGGLGHTVGMKECDKQSAEPGEHLGPFDFVEAQEEFSVERCRGCGNVVLRREPVERKAPGAGPGRPGLGGQ